VVTLVGDITTTKWRLRERNIIFVRGTSNPDENVYFCEGENEKKTHENIFSWRYYLNHHENIYF